MEISEEIIEKLEALHGEVLSLETELGSAVFRVATRTEWKRFMDEVNEPATRARSLEPLVFSCVVYPDEAEFKALISRRPGLVQAFGNELTEFCGLQRVTVSRKSRRGSATSNP